MKQCPMNLGGNFCGHDPQTPDFRLKKLIKTGKGGVPRIISLAVERLVRYYNSPALLPSLNFANESFRQQRTERREACVIVLSCLLQHMDVVSLRVGIPGSEGFFNYSLESIYNKTFLSKSRCERAFADLKAAAIISCSQARMKTEDGWVSANAVKCISANLFNALGLNRMLMIERKKASKRLSAKLDADARTPNLSGQGKQALYVSALARRLQKKNTKQGVSTTANTLERSYSHLSQAQKKAYQSKLLQLRQQQPDTPLTTLRSLALSSI